MQSVPSALHAQRDIVVEELRRRVGSTFTLAELAEVYAELRPVAVRR